jgi:NADPH:quinone reductase-like Zn-dependent oxidoreductase
MSVLGAAGNVGSAVIQMTKMIQNDADASAIAKANAEKTNAQARLTLAQTALGAAAG